jgi:LacI family gluconate utilization system Gnt-I transcriptional repressor
LQQYPETDAIFFDNDDLVVGAYLHCLQAGIGIPDKLALAGFNGLPFIEAMPMKITTIATPRLDMGIVAAELFLERMSSIDVEPAGGSRISMPLKLILGETS